MYKPTVETRRKVSESNKRWWQNPENKEKCIKSLKNLSTFENREKAREKLRGRKLSNEARLKISRANKGRELTKETRKKMSEAKKGEGSYQWKGGITPVNQVIRHSPAYRLWRVAVFERDNYTCSFCGKRGNGDLNADHIKSFALYPELRFDIDNGRTLCEDCHKTTFRGRPNN